MPSRSRKHRLATLAVATGTAVLAAVGLRHEPAAAQPKPGSNTVLTAPLETADGLEVIISDVVIPANGSVPRHYHPGEEFVYVIEGAAVHVEDGQEDRVYSAGDAFVIRKGRVHAPRAGDRPARAIVFRVHVAGQPERILVD